MLQRVPGDALGEKLRNEERFTMEIVRWIKMALKHASNITFNFLRQGNMWMRKGWAAMDTLRERPDDLKEVRDLVRSLGRGGGWGPLRSAPVQI